MNIAVILTLVFAVVATGLVSAAKPGNTCGKKQYGSYRFALQVCNNGVWSNSKTGGHLAIPIGKSCLDIKNKGLSYGNGQYMIDPLGTGKAFMVYCDMASFGGGWTMCYTTDNHVDIKTELTTTPKLGYRADCNNIPFTSVLFVDEKTNHKAAFTKNGSAVTFSGNYNKRANVYGEWTAQGVASTSFKYQLIICNIGFYKGLHMSGITQYKGTCFKRCNHWCGDGTSPYFRTAGNVHFAGVAFNENAHGVKPKRLISAGIR